MSSPNFQRADVNNVLAFSRYFLKKDLRTFDPYDLWFSGIGKKIKRHYHSHKFLMLPLAGGMTILDWIGEEVLRKCFFSARDYPIVRAQTALLLLSLFRQTQNADYLDHARIHLECLRNTATALAHGCGWGLPVDYAVSDSLVYPKATPMSTITPYAAEAFFEYQELCGDRTYEDLLERIFAFFEQDLTCILDDGEAMGFSYGPGPDRLVCNANSYTMYMLALSGKREQNREKIQKIFRFIQREQNPDGSWFYGADSKFIDGFHSCFVLKNLLKTSRIVRIPGMEETIRRGVRFWKERLIDAEHGLCRRFVQNNKPSFLCFDLYDNAESISLAKLIGERELAASLTERSLKTFFRRGHFYSQIDRLGFLHYKDSLRWAVTPFLRALAEPIYSGANL